MKSRKKVGMVAGWRLGLAHDTLAGVSEYIEAAKDIMLETYELKDFLSIPKWEIDGLIASFPPGYAEHFVSAPFPVVSTTWMPPEIDLPVVDSDPEACGVLAADYFLKLGHTNFATISSEEASSLVLRSRGFTNRLKACGVQTVEKLLFGADVKTKRPEDEARILAWFRALDKPTALFCSDDLLWSELHLLVEDANIFVPTNICVLGCSDEPIVCEHVHPTLSSIRLPYKKIGYECARLLDQLMRGEPPEKMKQLLPPVDVTVRMSTNMLATPDPNLRKAFNYIQQHSAEDITIMQIAEHAGVSIRNLQRRFKAELGRTPHQELHMARTARVKQLLRETDLTLSQIAERSGFTTEYWMSNLFKKMVGEPPGTYRKRTRLR